jgi:hypothetical protein
MKTIKLAWVASYMLAVGGCGGDSGGAADSSNSSGAPPGSSRGASNTAAVIVDSGPAAAGGTVNEPFVSVTLCAPANPSNCQTIDHVLVDTDSYGLRVVFSVLTPSLSESLPQRTDSNNNAVVECTIFADGYSWGPIKIVTLQIGGESAAAVPMQVIGDPRYGKMVPTDCAGAGPPEDTVATFGANGVLGVGAFAQDCGNACVDNVDAGVYYVCSSACQPTLMSLAQQVPHPVTLFATDNNGVILTFPTVPANGAQNLSGTLTFGVGTNSNNGLGGAQVHTLDPVSGYFTKIFNGVSYADSLLDSGSNGLFFDDSGIPQCSDNSGFYCPTSPFNLSAVNLGLNGTSSQVSFSIANAETVFAKNPNSTAFSQLGGINGDSNGFDWGLPFFFGRSVYTVIEGHNSIGGLGPYVAY